MDERSEVEFMRCGLTIWVVLGLVGGGIATESRAQAQPREQLRLVGRVFDEARHPIERVEVVVNRREVRAISDGAGIFVLNVSPDDRTVGFRRIGYRPMLFTIRPLLVPRDTIAVELVSSPIELPEVIVSGQPTKPLRYAGTTKYDEVFQRRKLGFGRLIPREAIDRRWSARTYQLLEGLAGVRVYGPPFEGIRFVRCAGRVGVYIDGIRQLGSVADLSRVYPSDIEMIEVYSGVAEIPGVFFWGDDCAVIAVWTRWNE